RVHQGFPDHDLVRRGGTGPGGASPDAVPGDSRHLDQVGLNRAIENECVSQSRACVACRIAVFELEAAEPGLDGLGADPAMRVDADGAIPPWCLCGRDQLKAWWRPAARRSLHCLSMAIVHVLSCIAGSGL